MKTPTVLLFAVSSALSLAACGDKRNASREAPAAQVRVLATVNGVAITELDVEQRSKGALGGGPGHDVPASLVQTIVRDELVYQKATELGLDQEPGYRLKIDLLRAQVRAVERQEISALFRRWVHGQAAVTEAEARDYFDKNSEFIRTRFHVLQILYKGKFTEIAKDHEDVKGGTPFEAVAARRFPVLPDGTRPPWDLGELTWVQIPQAWRGIVDRLEPGQVSDVIQGPNDRFWVVKLAGKRVDPGMSFESEKDRILELLREQKSGELYDRMLSEMKVKAKVVYSK